MGFYKGSIIGFYSTLAANRISPTLPSNLKPGHTPTTQLSTYLTWHGSPHPYAEQPEFRIPGAGFRMKSCKFDVEAGINSRLWYC